MHAKDVKTEQGLIMGHRPGNSGASGAELANIINEAALRAVREGRSAVNQRDLQESVETVIAGYERKNAVLTPKESWRSWRTTRSAMPWSLRCRSTPRR